MTHTPGTSVFPLLEPLLEQVSKPIQYVGGELNSTVKDWNCGGYGPDGEELTTRWALMYPDAYEVGVPNQGVMILYEVLNERPDALAERTYAVWPDLEALMREHRACPSSPSTPTGRIRDFDVLGLSFSTELGYTNMLTALDLAGIPLHAVDRTDDDPIVVAGGHAAFNPEPVADFVDAAIVGDGEEAVLAVTAPHRRVEGARVCRVAGASCCCAWPGPVGSTSRRSTTSPTWPTGGSSGSRPRPTPTASRGGCRSTPSWTSTPGPTRSSRWCRWPSRCTSGCRSRSSAAAPAAAGSARPA